MSVEDAIRNLIDESDIAFRSDVFEEVSRELIDTGLNLAFFVFATSGHSSCARTVDGVTASCPVLTLYLRYDADFRETGIDPHQGNWDDKWVQTRTIRDSFNTILLRHGFANDFVSAHTFVFLRTLEELAFVHVGRKCKQAVEKLVCVEAPGVAVANVFWNGRQFDVILHDKSDYKRVKRNVKAKIANELPKLLATSDVGSYCQSYDATIKFGYTGMNLANLIREDIA
ncbi:MAG: hypothetical protein ABIK07_12190 [Planctomycetota bacterium]